MQRPTSDATMKFLSVNDVFTRATLLVLLSFTSFRTVCKEFVPLCDEKHDPSRLGIGHRGRYSSGFCFEPAPAFGVSFVVCRHGAKIPSSPNGKRLFGNVVPWWRR